MKSVFPLARRRRRLELHIKDPSARRPGSNRRVDAVKIGTRAGLQDVPVPGGQSCEKGERNSLFALIFGEYGVAQDHPPVVVIGHNETARLDLSSNVEESRS